MEDGLAALLPPSHGKVAVALEDMGCGQKPYTTLIFRGKEGGTECWQPRRLAYHLAYQGSAAPGHCLIPSSSDSTNGWRHLQSPKFLDL